MNWYRLCPVCFFSCGRGAGKRAGLIALHGGCPGETTLWKDALPYTARWPELMREQRGAKEESPLVPLHQPLAGCS